jgi:ribose transport system ATP-binding protein
MTHESTAVSAPPTDGTPAEASPSTGSGLRISGLSKTFPGVRALAEVDLNVRGGSVHALLGHNGCGKSTLVKTLAGYHHPDDGASAWLDGETLQLGSSDAAARAGIRFVHQELGLIAELGAMDNVGLALGYKSRAGGLIAWQEQARHTRALLERFGIDIDLDRPLSAASPVERTAVAIVRAVAGWDPGRGLLVLDEPTAALPAREVESLFKLITDVRDSGTAVLLVSHRLDEVMAIADEATVMRAGEVIWTGATETMSVRKFATLIAGEEVQELESAIAEDLDHHPQPTRGEPLLKARGLTARFLQEVDLDVWPGEIVGVAGLLGSGREELPYVLAGAARQRVAGSVEVDGAPVRPLDVKNARARGVVLVPADRTHESVISAFSVRENVSLANVAGSVRPRLISPAGDRRFGRRWLSAVRADPDVSDRSISTLSGGNQQKAVLARWLSVAPRVLTVSEPTAGIDIGARTVIYGELRRRADEGLAIVMSSSDSEDLIAVCDRVIVLRDGAVVVELSRKELNKTAILAAMEGVHGEHA